MTTDNAQDFWGKGTGAHLDHAEDQKKFFRILGDKKKRYNREKQGKDVMLYLTAEELANTIFTITQDTVIAAGGIKA